ncbi:MAG TPA: DUF547 domain-containing protein [Hyphomonadaceae bacterium]|nr:DUF547 domain-containing protein [Hyphomonadaceae bacterium]
MRFFLTALAALLLSAAPAAADEAAYDTLLARYVSASADGVNRVDYARWSNSRDDRAALDAYVAELAGQRPSTFERDRAFATWVNLYNAVTLQVILERYPIASIRDIRSEGTGLDPRALIGPWRTKRVTVEGRRLSLDDIENTILRPTFRDPRVHYAINCASIGCPNLMPRAWRAENLEADLDAAARAYVNHPRGVSVNANGTLRVSSIYRWFRADFGGTDANVIAHLRRYALPELAARLSGATRIAGHGYDWALNGR